MSEPLKPHEAVAHAALALADPEAEMRKELRKMIEEIVEAFLTRELLDVTRHFGTVIVNDQRHAIASIAKSAIKQHFNTPAYIADY